MAGGGHAALARSLEERLRALPVDGHAPDLAVDGFRDAFGAVMWGTHRMARAGTGYAPEFLHQVGRSQRDAERLCAYAGDSPTTPFLYDPERPDVAQRNRVLVMDRAARIPSAARGLLDSAGLSGLHQIRVVVCDGPELLGWFGGFRERPFTAKDERLLRKMVPALRTAFLWKRRLARADIAHPALDVAMDALACPAFIVRDRCAIEHANRAGRALLEARGRGLVTEIADECRAGTAERILIRGNGLSSLELVVLRDANARLLAALARATEQWRLTPRQRDVLALVAAGDTNKSIATKLRCAEVTIELHVTSLLRKARASTRTELVARMWSGESGL